MQLNQGLFKEMLVVEIKNINIIKQTNGGHWCIFGRSYDIYGQNRELGYSASKHDVKWFL